MNDRGAWSVSPAYDLTFSSGPAGEHCTTIRGEGRHLNLNHLLKLAAVGGIKETTAKNIIDEVKNAVSQWKIFSADAYVSKESSDLIKKSVDQIFKKIFI